ncbi:MAG: mechanosensitive ion channel [Phycisphaeraceae bacterium]|nr:mechanosensitive ion channel [Phycisphaeraceae bacterium]MCB9847780.1 mechanosensitive ion channel [Phycisphaeraceae bacterium]
MNRLLSSFLAQTDAAQGVADAADTGAASSLPVEPGTLLSYGVSAVKVILIVFVGWVLAGWARRLTRNALKRAGIELTLAKFLSNLSRWAILALVVISVMSVFGIETTSFAALIGAAGLAIGLAFQGTLGNMASGIMLLLFRPFKVGDFITCAGVSGTVDEIELFFTTLDTPENRRIIIPNGNVFGSTIENVTHHARRRVDVAVGVEYSAAIDETRAALLQAVQTISQMEGALSDPAPAVVLGDLGDSAVAWSCRVWARTPDFLAVKQALTREVKAGLDAANIGIPFPQMDVHLDGALERHS